MKNYRSVPTASHLCRWALCLLLLFCLLPLSDAAAAAPDLTFADSLFREGDYLNAAHEYKRLLFSEADAPNRDFIAFRVAASYQNAGRLDAAIRAYTALIDMYPKSVLVARAKTNIAECRILSGASEQGIAALTQFLTEHKQSALAPRAHFTIGMLHADKGDWRQARNVWNELFATYPESPFADISDKFARYLQATDLFPHRSRTLAGLLSTVLPGSGQVYAGRTLDGLATFVSVALLTGASLYYVDNERLEVAVPVGILGLFFYGNGIYQSVHAARTFNRYHEHQFRNRLQQEIRDSQLFGVRTPEENRAVSVLWRHRF